MVVKKDQNFSVILFAKEIKIWHLFLLSIFMTFIMLTALRLNNVAMIRRKEAILNADKTLDINLMEDRLSDLQSFVSKHINTSTGQFFLKTLFERDADAAIRKAEKAMNNSGADEIYRKIAAVCDSIRGISYTNYIECYKNESAKYNVVGDINYNKKVELPNPQLYVKEFISPKFSYDWAGLSVVIWGFMMILLLLKILSWLILSILLKYYSNKI